MKEFNEVKQEINIVGALILMFRVLIHDFSDL